MAASLLNAAMSKQWTPTASLSGDALKAAAQSLAAMDKNETTTTTPNAKAGATGLGGMIGSGLALGATVMFPALAPFTMPLMAAGGAVGGGIEGGMSESGNWAGGAVGGGAMGAMAGAAPTMMGMEGGWAGITKGAADSLGTATGGILGTAAATGVPGAAGAGALAGLSSIAPTAHGGVTSALSSVGDAALSSVGDAALGSTASGAAAGALDSADVAKTWGELSSYSSSSPLASAAKVATGAAKAGAMPTDKKIAAAIGVLDKLVSSYAAPAASSGPGLSPAQTHVFRGQVTGKPAWEPSNTMWRMG